MFSIVVAIGWPIWPLILASVVALALIIERAVALRRSRALESNSPLGRVLAAALRNERAGREIAHEAVANAGNHAAHELSKNLSLVFQLNLWLQHSNKLLDQHLHWPSMAQ